MLLNMNMNINANAFLKFWPSQTKMSYWKEDPNFFLMLSYEWNKTKWNIFFLSKIYIHLQQFQVISEKKKNPRKFINYLILMIKKIKQNYEEIP